MLQEPSEYNRLLVLKTIRRQGPISRIELAAATGLGVATISEVTGSLVGRGLVSEQRQAPRGKGRPRLMLQVNARAAVVIGANISPWGTLQASFTDLAGNRLHGAELPMRLNRSIAEMAEDIGDLLLQIIRAAPTLRAGVSVVALALPGVVDSAGGHVHWVTTMPPVSTPFAAIVAKKLRLPVVVESEVEGLARAQHWFGAHSPRDDFSLVYVGLYIGLASYADGRPRSGINGISSEFGHVKTAYGEGARPCYCGSRGCLTCYGLLGSVGESVLRQQHGARPFPLDLLETYNGIVHSAAGGDAKSLAIIEETATHLGIALSNYINTGDPGYVLVLTESPDLPDLLRAPLEATLASCTMPAILQRTTVVVEAVDGDWRSKGAAALALEQSYANSGVLPSRGGKRARRVPAATPRGRDRRRRRA